MRSSQTDEVVDSAAPEGRVMAAGRLQSFDYDVYIDYCVLSAVSSRTKLVVPPLVSVSEPVNLRVTVCPA
jgi:hypothetical protein